MTRCAGNRNHRASCYWLTGLPGAGKTTLANHVCQVLISHGIRAIVLDGDQLRQGLNSDLGYSRAERRENIRRIAEVARILVDAGLVVLVSAISPYREDRLAARSRFANGSFFEVFVATDLGTAMARDPKGLYALAQAGKISHLTGWDDPYEPPEAPDIKIETADCSVAESADSLVSLILDTLEASPANS